MALNKQIWLSTIVENLYADNSFATKSVDDSAFVVNKTVHIPNAGAPSKVVTNRTEKPAKVSQRTDNELTYDMDELTTDPIYIPNIDTVELSYDKRNSVIANDRAQLQEAAHVNILERWGGGLNTDHVLLTTGAAPRAAHTSATATGQRKPICKADVMKLMTAMDADNVPIHDGDTVFMTINWRRGTVVGFEGEFALVEYDARDVNGSTMTVRTTGGCLTHKPPIRDADGKRIKVGDTVYANADASGDGTAWRVRSLNPGLAHSVKAERADGSNPALVRDLVPAWLTHEPDTWERIEHEALVIDQLIDSEWGGDPKDARNLVRRCKALGERDR